MNCKENIKKILAFVCILVISISSVTILAPIKESKATDVAATESVAPIYLPGFKNVTLSSFNSASNLSGTQVANKIYVDGYSDPDEGTASSEQIVGYLTNMQKETNVSFDRTLVSMWVNFKEAKGITQTRIQMAGATNDNVGAWFCAQRNDQFVIQDRWSTSTRTAFLPISATNLDATTGEFLLQLSFEYSESATNTANTDVTIGVYINGELCSGEVGDGTKFWAEDGKIHFTDVPSDKMGGVFKLYSDAAPNGTTCTLTSCVPKNDNLTQIAWSDFACSGTNGSDDTFTSTSGADKYYKHSISDITKMGSTSFEADIKFHNGADADCRLYYGGANAYAGMRFQVASSGNLNLIGISTNPMIFTPAVAGVNSFVNEFVRMKITTEYGDYDGNGDANDAQLGFYFNNQLYNNQYCYVMDYTTNNMINPGNGIGIYTKNDNSITIKVPVQESEPKDPVVYLPGFKHVTLSSFYNGTYADEKYNEIGNPVRIPEGTSITESLKYYITSDGETKETGSFDQTLLSFRMNCSSTSSNTRLRILATDAYNGGLAIQKNSTGKRLVLNDCDKIGVDGNIGGYGQANIFFESDVVALFPERTTTVTDFNEEFTLQVSIEYGDFPIDGFNRDDISGNDIQLGFYINGEFYDFDQDGKYTDNDKVKFLDCDMDKVGNVFSIEQKPGASFELNSVVPESRALTSIEWNDFTCANAIARDAVYLPEFEHVTLSSFYNKNYADEKYNEIGNPVNIQEGTCTNSSLYYGITKTDSFDQTLLSLRMNCSSMGKDTRLRIFATGSQAGGVGIQKNSTGEMLVLNDCAQIGNDGANIKNNATYFDPAKITTLKSFNDEFNLQVSIEYGDFPMEGKFNDAIAGNDIRLGFYFNGEFYDFDNDGKKTDSDSVTLLNCDMSKVGTYFSIEQNNGASVDLYSLIPDRTDARVHMNQYWKYQLDTNRYSDVSSLGATSFEANVIFTGGGEDERIYYGGKDDWRGLAIRAEYDGRLNLHSYADQSPSLEYVGLPNDADVPSNIYFQPTIAGVGSSFIDTEFKLRITTQYADYNGDGVMDAELGFFFNDKLYDNRYIYLSGYGADENIGNCIGVYNKNAAIIIRTVPGVKEVSHDLADGAYGNLMTDFVDAKQMYMGKTQVKDLNAELSIPGDYDVLDSEGNLIGRVILYQNGDVHPDGFNDVRDLIAMKKVQQGVILSTWSGRLGAYATEEFDTEVIIERLLGIERAGELIMPKYLDFLSKGVMPIRGGFGPHPKDENLGDEAIDFITDDYFKMLKDAGINILMATRIDYEKRPNLVTKNLNLAAKYGMGYMVNDSGIHQYTTNKITAQELEERVAKYRNYPAFAGMYMVDEPNSANPDGYFGNLNKPISDYTKLVDALNQLKVGHFSCAFPIKNTYYNDTTQMQNYKEYITEFCSGMKPEVLVYDHYPFPSTVEPNFNAYFWNMDLIRTEAKNKDVPFGVVIQAGAYFNDSSTEGIDTTFQNYPNEAQFDWNVNTCLAMGAKMINYFPTIQPLDYARTATGEYDFRRNGLIGADGIKNVWYDYAQRINKQIAAVDEVLMNSLNEGLIASGDEANKYLNSTSCVIKSGTYKELIGVVGNAIIGCFDYEGKTALYVVNNDMEEEGIITLTFKQSYNMRVVEDATTSHKKAEVLELNMKAGEGVLLVIDEK